MGRLGTFTRRSFLVVSTAVLGGAVFGYYHYRKPLDNPLEADLVEGESSLTPYVRIDTDGITVIVPRAEMGQGVRTTLAALVAEELNVSMDAIRIEHGPASNAYYNSAILTEGVPFAPTDDSLVANTARRLMDVPARFLGMQITGGSSSVPDAFDKHRRAGAAARVALVRAAAQRLGVGVDDLRTENAAVITADGQSLSYIELAPDTVGMDLPAEPELKPPDQWTLLGKSLPREDMWPKCCGQARFSIDTRLEGLRYASVRTNPHLGAALKDYDASEALGMPGVESVVAITGGVAVIATNTWYAMQAVAAIECDWQSADYPDTSDDMIKQVATVFDTEEHDSRMRDDGDVDTVLASGVAVVDAEYRVPYLAHATMEPLNATVLVHAYDDADVAVEVWVGTQAPTQVVKEVAALAGVDDSRVRVYTTLMGGGFGRRAEMDYVKQATEVALSVKGTPIKLTWSREEDTTHDAYRPLAMARMQAAVSDDRIEALDLSLVASSVMASQLGRLGISLPGPDASIVQGAWEQPYAIEHYRVTGLRAPEMLPVSSWRAVGASQNGFFHESAIDELAYAAGADPLEFRLRHIDHPASRKVLESVRELSDWGSELPAGHARGVAFVLSFGVPVAEVIEVRVDAAGVKLINAYAAVDVGVALDPDNIRAQVMGGLNFGLAAAMYGEITVADGRVQQSNFHDFPSLRLDQAPAVQVKLLQGGGHIRGIGEPGTPPAAPALANAIFAASGQRIRELPLRNAIAFV